MRASRSPCSRSPPRPPSCSSPRSPPTCCCSRSASAGRFDATNVIDRPAAAVVTPDRPRPRGISRHHARRHRRREGRHLQARLPGRHRAAGLPARPTRPCAPRPSASAPRRSSSAQQDFSVHEEGGRLVYQDEKGLLDLPRPRLVGRHQYINAGTAIAALRAAGFEQFETSAFEAGRHPRRMAGPPAAPRPRAACRSSRPKAASSGSTAATTPMAAGCSPPPWPTQSERSDAPLVLIVGMLGTKDSDGLLHAISSGLAREVDRRADHRPDRRAPGRRGRLHRGQRRADHLDRSRASNRRSPRSTTTSGTARPAC